MMRAEGTHHRVGHLCIHGCFTPNITPNCPILIKISTAASLFLGLSWHCVCVRLWLSFLGERRSILAKHPTQLSVQLSGVSVLSQWVFAPNFQSCQPIWNFFGPKYIEWLCATFCYVFMFANEIVFYAFEPLIRWCKENVILFIKPAILVPLITIFKVKIRCIYE